MYVTHRTKKKQTNTAVEVDRTCDNLYGQKSPLQMYIYNIYYMYISPLQMYIYNVYYMYIIHAPIQLYIFAEQEQRSNISLAKQTFVRFFLYSQL